MKNKPTLDDLANLYSTDKGTKYPYHSVHGYAPIYESYLSPLRDKSLRILEVGICMEGSEGGHSIKMWNDYFEKASIYTFDIVDVSNHMNTREFKCTKILTDLIENEGLVGIKTSFEDEGASFNETIRLKKFVIKLKLK
jgi:hypothetical protein